MSTIKILNLHLSAIGAELFDDSESFLNELNIQQINSIKGGESIISQVSYSIGLLSSDNNIAGVETPIAIANSSEPLYLLI
ncbi:hypothetical protein HCG51_06680 [Tolypothrix sp. PCC 7910]|uniref:hypothetical protein n=1 Tax=Tolypothrix sp. PCC 7910 TaxID=2099387 RepID=UPI0014279E2C|nr:hypothetical protein [Tolypothrix sp. PCC 7910]QIR35267.1 hypothetical protein HCG51_06680 [Tolypothrix sp. PCC 7910]